MTSLICMKTVVQRLSSQAISMRIRRLGVTRILIFKVELFRMRFFNKKTKFSYLLSWTIYYHRDRMLCLSPLLFNLYTAELHTIVDENCKMFANDFFILAKYRSFIEAKAILQSKLIEFKNLCETINLKFNPEKNESNSF